jgi:broad specificity phosphatase PhoE
MPALRRLVLVRHGETVGNSSVRFHGRRDVALSAEGRAQMRATARALRGEVFDRVVASPLRRSWQGAAIAAGGAPVELEPDLREVDFGRWEGLTAEEIRASDPVLYEDWRARAPHFEFPGGERRAAFQARVERALERLRASGATSALLVIHKGPIRVIAEHLLGRALEDGIPELGGFVGLTRRPEGTWFVGRHGSDPEALGEAA